MKKQSSSSIKQKGPDERSLQSLRNIGPALEHKLKSIGVHTVSDFIEADPVQLYQSLQTKLGYPVDRCVLYCCKGAQLDLPWYKCKNLFQEANSSKLARDKAAI